MTCLLAVSPAVTSKVYLLPSLRGSSGIYQDSFYERNHHIPIWRCETETLPSRTWFVFLPAARLVRRMLPSRLLVRILFLLLVRPLALAPFPCLNRFHMLYPSCWWELLNCKILLASGKKKKKDNSWGSKQKELIQSGAKTLVVRYTINLILCIRNPLGVVNFSEWCLLKPNVLMLAVP